MVTKRYCRDCCDENGAIERIMCVEHAFVDLEQASLLRQNICKKLLPRVLIKINSPFYWLNSFGAIVFFREHSPAIFWRPQNIIKQALYCILALYSLNPNLNPNQNRTHVPRYLLVLKFAYFATVAPLIFLYENTK